MNFDRAIVVRVQCHDPLRFVRQGDRRKLAGKRNEPRVACLVILKVIANGRAIVEDQHKLDVAGVPPEPRERDTTN